VTAEAEKHAAAGATTSGAGAPAPTPAPTPAAAPAPAAGNPAEAGVAKLVELGFSREAAVQALQAAGGNVDMAAAMLFGGM